MDNYTWDLTIKQNSTQPNKYIGTSSSPVTLESAKQPVEELNLKQLNIDNTHFSSNGETKASKDTPVPVSIDSKQGKSVSELS